MKNEWMLEQKADLKNIGHYETIYTLANGYAGLRGTPGFLFYEGKPGFYPAGVYNNTPVFGSELVNLPSFINYSVKVDGEKITAGMVDSLKYSLDMRAGVLVIEAVVRGQKGRKTAIREERFLHSEKKETGTMRTEITPLNYNGNIYISCALDVNAAVTDVRGEKIHHLEKISDDISKNGVYLETETTHTKINIGQFVRLKPASVKTETRVFLRDDAAVSSFESAVYEGRPVVFDIFSSVFHSGKSGELRRKSERAVIDAEKAGFARLQKEHADVLKKIWKT
ncbi:MAG TPA: hypothetical protein ENN55_04615, partial [Firmicutes bacterium]|nr:hypothetical protein [Bacillota bacterium]